MNGKNEEKEKIQFAQDGMIGELKEIWKECFEDSDNYIDFYYKKRFQKENTLVYLLDDKIVSMLTMLPAQIQKEGKYQSVRYIYALGTRKAYRKRGYAKRLLEEAERKTKEPFILIPETKALFSYYRKLGFEFNFFLTKDKKRREEIIWDERVIEVAEAAQYKHIRDEKFKREGYLQWNEEAISYAIEENRFLGGEAYIIKDLKTGEKDIVFVRKQNEDIEILEISQGGNRKKSLQKELEKIYSRCKNITFYLEGEKMAFAMSKGIEIERGRGYFNLGLQ